MFERASEPVRVLVIAYDQPLWELLADVLTDEGYRVVTTDTGSDGLMLSDIAAPQLVLLDLQLPDLTGASVLETIRHYRDTCALPVVLLSAASVIPPLVRELAHAVVAMPFDLSVLLTVVRDVVPPLGGARSLEPTHSTALYPSA